MESRKITAEFGILKFKEVFYLVGCSWGQFKSDYPLEKEEIRIKFSNFLKTSMEILKTLKQT